MTQRNKQERFERQSSNYQQPAGRSACRQCVLYNYQDFCKIHDVDMGSESSNVQFFAAGLASESGEVIGAAMKHYVYAPDRASRNDILKEVGDSLWYAANVLSQLDSSFSEAMSINIDKLTKRYPERHVVNHEESNDIKSLERLIILQDCVARSDFEKEELDERINNMLCVEHD